MSHRTPHTACTPRTPQDRRTPQTPHTARTTTNAPHPMRRQLIALVLTAALGLGQTSLLASPLAVAEETCATSVPATQTAIEAQASFADTYRELHQFATGAGVRVAVIDTGITVHPRLPEIIDGGDFLTDALGSPLEDCDGHGTVVASVLAAQDTGDGIVGLAPGVELLSIRQTTMQPSSIETEGTSVASLIRAIDAALEQGAQVINLSLAACLPADQEVDFTPVEEVLARAERQGAIVVAAAGNHSEQCDDDSRVIPASFDTVVAVSAHDDDLDFSDFALRPQQQFISTRGEVDAAVSFSGSGLAGALGSAEYPTYFAGTSFATPVVSGTAALLRERYPQATAAQIRQRLYAGADDYHQVFSPSKALLNPEAASPAINAYHLPEAAGTTTATAADSLDDATSPRLIYLLAVLLSVGAVGFTIGKILGHKKR